MKREKLHNHPYLEKELGLDENHVIIDRPTFERLMQKEQPQPERSAVEILKSHWISGRTNPQFGSIIKAMEEYRSQCLPEVTDEAIEKLLMHVDYVPMNEKVDVVRRWMRKQLTGK